MSVKIKKLGNNFKILYNNRVFPCKVGFKEFNEIIAEKSKASAALQFLTFVNTLDAKADMGKIREELVKQQVDSYEVYVETEEEIQEDIELVETYEEVSELVVRALGKDFEHVFKQMVASIVSMWYAETESVYVIMLAKPGSGKSTLCELFDLCEDAHVTDSLSPHALDPGTATIEQETNSVLDEAANKTLIVHDLTAIFSDSADKSRRFKGVFENIFGKDGYKKSSPGSGTRTYGKRLNLIFGVTPYVFWQTYPNSKKKIGGDWINSERYLYIHVPERNQYDDYIDGRIVRDLTSIKRKVAGFLKSLKTKYFNPEITKDTRKQIAELVYDEYSKDSYKKNTATRRMKQCEMFCKALMLIEGKRQVLTEHITSYGELLKLRDEPKKKVTVTTI